MTVGVRRLVHPGPIAAARVDSFVGSMNTIEFDLEPGLTFRDAVARPLEASGITSAGLLLTGFCLQPFRYVIPATSRDDEHVAYYSETFEPAEVIHIDYANATFGSRDGEPFVHCHALWHDRHGQLRGGHVLPFETVVSAPGRVIAFGCDGVAMIAQPDAETNFTLFGPVEVAKAIDDTKGECVVARVRPNEDLIESIEKVCRRHAISQAVIRSGVGSIVGAVFEDGRRIAEIPTEILILDGNVRTDLRGQLRVDVEIALIDTRGSIHKGRPARGQNPILICLELVLEPVERNAPPATSR